MILLDTHAVIWLRLRNKRARRLERIHGGLFVSPATLLELQVLIEVGKLTLRHGATSGALLEDERFAMDEPPSARWFDLAVEHAWTRDPFDRLLAAHARLRGWRLATSDQVLIEHLGEAATFEL